MKKLPLIAIYFFVIYFLCSCASAPAFKEKIEIPADIAGIVHAGSSRTQKEFDYLDYLGVKWVLHTFSWGTIEPYQGEWDFLVHDALVDKTMSAGIKVIGVLAYDNWWIYDDKNTHRNITPSQLPHFIQYVKKTAEHFKGRVDAWCIWNEPDTYHFWKGTAEDFFELTRQTADAVREVDSEVVILGGAITRGIFGLHEKFIRGLFESGAMDKTDAVAFHPYELNPARSLSLYAKFKKIVDDYGFGDKIWITEVGYPTGGRYPTKVREKRFPEYVVKTSVNLSASGAPTILWYQLFDPPERDRKNSENFFGLVRSRRDFTSKGSEAFSLCANYLPGTTCYPLEAEGLPNSLRAFWFKGTGDSRLPSDVLVVWNERGSKQIRLQLPGTDHARRDLVSGKANPVQAEIVVQVGRTPVFITWENQLLQNGEGKPVLSIK